MTLPTTKFLRDLVVVLGVNLLLLLTITRYVAIPWTVGGASMEPALSPGDRVVVDLFSYRRRSPREGEVALLEGPRGVPLVKRVVGRADPEPVRSALAARAADEEWFSVLGDNEAKSIDSRQLGPIPRHRFRGRLVWRYWPLGRAGPIR